MGSEGVFTAFKPPACLAPQGLGVRVLATQLFSHRKCVGLHRVDLADNLLVIVHS